MRQANMILPERLRNIRHCTFGWVDHNFLHQGHLNRLSHEELLLYFFLILVADRHGVSFYDYARICQLLNMQLDDYLRARDQLCERSLIAYRNGIFQVLSLPEGCDRKPPPLRVGRVSSADDFQTLHDVLQKLSR